MNDDLKREFLKEMRTKLGITQSEVAKKVGICQVFYSEIERGVKNPSLGTALKIADFYNIDVRVLKK